MSSLCTECVISLCDVEIKQEGGLCKILFRLNSDSNWLYATSSIPIKRCLYPTTFNVIELGEGQHVPESRRTSTQKSSHTFLPI